MLPIIIIAIIGTVLAVAVYQLIIQKYYWGPNGPPGKKETRKGKADGKE
ncbi:MAG TPA: hypothetical protein VF544_02995 [Pyrinomonadaceae bacterium]